MCSRPHLPSSTQGLCSRNDTLLFRLPQLPPLYQIIPRCSSISHNLKQNKTKIVLGPTASFISIICSVSEGHLETVRHVRLHLLTQCSPLRSRGWVSVPAPLSGLFPTGSPNTTLRKLTQMTTASFLHRSLLSASMRPRLPSSPPSSRVALPPSSVSFPCSCSSASLGEVGAPQAPFASRELSLMWLCSCECHLITQDSQSSVCSS